MTTALWIVQVLLALAFGMAGIMKLTQPREKMAARMAWVEGFSQTQIRMIGAVEVLGALGVILPMLTGILPILTPLAAAGLVLTMIGAGLTHIQRSEYASILPNVVLALLAAVVVYGRLIAIPVA
jgi:uncharacterized membrane protein